MVGNDMGNMAGQDMSEIRDHAMQSHGMLEPSAALVVRMKVVTLALMVVIGAIASIFLAILI
ncbi:MAG: hypothetical protein AAF495_19785 [Pseudomonadota bacterium]